MQYNVTELDSMYGEKCWTSLKEQYLRFIADHHLKNQSINVICRRENFLYHE